MSDMNEFAGVVALAIRAEMAKVLERVAVIEAAAAQWAEFEKSMSGLRERLVVAETKAALLEQRPVPVLETKSVEPLPAWIPDLADIRRRVEVLEEAPNPFAVPPPVDLTPLVDRLAALETKASKPVELPEFVTSGRLLLLAEKADRAVEEVTSLTKDMSTLRERVAVVEVRPPVPGPPGPAGKDGEPGRDGKDGTAGLEFEGVYQEGQTYEKGQMATWAGSMWHANETTTARPGESKAWTLCVKKGRDGKDGKDAQPLPVVTVR
jgi:hypothetical protein